MRENESVSIDCLLRQKEAAKSNQAGGDYDPTVCLCVSKAKNVCYITFYIMIALLPPRVVGVPNMRKWDFQHPPTRDTRAGGGTACARYQNVIASSCAQHAQKGEEKNDRAVALRPACLLPGEGETVWQGDGGPLSIRLHRFLPYCLCVCVSDVTTGRANHGVVRG